jgi:tetratricopeptide (TPR) repeat protein
LLREELQNLAPLGELQAAHVEALESWFSNWEGRWRECGECLPEVIPAVQHLWEMSESNRAAWLTYQGFETGRRIGELEIALRILQQEEAPCLELGNKEGLQRSYGNQALILFAWGRLEEAFELHKKKEALCLELGSRSGLAYCYANWGLLAREQGDRKTEREKLTAALDIFTKLNIPRERDAVRAELEKTTGADRAT